MKRRSAILLASLSLLLFMAPACPFGGGQTRRGDPELDRMVQRAKSLYEEKKAAGDDLSRVDPLIAEVRQAQRAGDTARLREAVEEVLALLEPASPPPPPGESPPVAAAPPAAESSAEIAESPFGYGGDGTYATKFGGEAGGEWARANLTWGVLEPSRGRYEWSRMDKMVRDYQGTDITVLPVFKTISRWAGTSKQIDAATRAKSGHKRSWLPPNLDDWSSFVTRAVERYDGDGVDDMPGLRVAVHDYQFEYEYPRSWEGTAQEYLKLMRATRTAMRKADPKARLAMAGIISEQATVFAVCDGLLDDTWLVIREKKRSKAEACNHPTISNFRKDIEEVLRGGTDAFDVVDLHLYGFYQTIPQRVAWLRGRMEEYGYSKPIWALEVGGPYTSVGETYTQDKEADYVWKLHTVALASGVEKIAWFFDVGGGEWGPEFRNLCMVTESGRKKPSFTAYQTMTRYLDGLSSVDKVDLGAGVWAYRYEVKGRSVYAVWSDKRTTVRIPWSGGSATVVDVKSKESPARLENGAVVVEVSASPLLIR